MITITNGEVAIDAAVFTASSDVRFDAKLAAADTDDLSEGASNLYWTVARGESMFDSKLAAADTGDLAEGSNLYFTDARARAAVSVTDAGGDGSLAYNSSTGVITYTGPSAAEVRAHFSGGEMITITSGAVAIDAAVFSASSDVRFDAKLAAADTDDLSEGASNLYWTVARGESMFDSKLAAADTDDLSEGQTNLYFTNARARQAISVTDAGGDGSLAYDNSTGVITYTGPSAAEVRAHFSAGEMISISSGQIAVDAAVFSASADVRFDAKLAAADTDDLSEGASNLYWTVARGESMFDSKLAAADTDDLAEGASNLYFTNARAQAAISVSDTTSVDLTYSAGQISADLKLNAGDGANSFEIAAGGLRLKSSVAGSGLTLSAGGVLSVDSGALNAIGDANDNLAVGFNYASADITANRTWTLPASPAAGDVVHIKAALVGSNKIIVAAGAGDTIDGVASIEIESDQGAVSLMAISDSAWKIF
jgi:hypothetical protein